MIQTTADRFLKLIWMPTLACPLKCAYCAARMFPNVTHKGHLSPEEWMTIFAACPLPVKQVAITGGEPSAYGRLGEVIASADWSYCIDTNLRNDPATWLTEENIPRLVAANCGLQFHPDHPEAESYWERIKWLKEVAPHAQIVCVQVYLWRDLPSQWERAIEKCAELGIEHRPTTFDDSFLWKGRFPVRPGSIKRCYGGYDFGMIMPDSAVYRCIGHAYHAIDVLGKLNEGGWDILLKEPTLCETLLCTVCDMCDKES